jgi:hypothetical protein
VYELARSPEFSALPLITEDTIKDLGGKYNCKFVILIKKNSPI